MIVAILVVQFPSLNTNTFDGQDLSDPDNDCVDVYIPSVPSWRAKHPWRYLSTVAKVF